MRTTASAAVVVIFLLISTVLFRLTRGNPSAIMSPAFGAIPQPRRPTAFFRQSGGNLFHNDQHDLLPRLRIHQDDLLIYA